MKDKIVLDGISAAVLESTEFLYENLPKGIWILTIKISDSLASNVSFISVPPKDIMC